MRISDWSSDVCSSDLGNGNVLRIYCNLSAHELVLNTDASTDQRLIFAVGGHAEAAFHEGRLAACSTLATLEPPAGSETIADDGVTRSEEHTSELQSLMRISYAVFCLKKKNKHYTSHLNILILHI